jgi:hypothetical protein
MRNWMKLLGTAALVSASVAQAQTTIQWSAPPSGEAPRYHLPMGTEVYLRTVTEINTKDNKAGDRVYLEVAEPISFRGQVIVPAGSPVVAEVSRVQRNGHFGRKGKLDIRLQYMQTPNGPVRLTGSGSDEGISGTVASVATIVLVSPLGFLIHGTSGYLKAGTVVKGMTADPVHFSLSSPQQQHASMQVQADGLPTPKPGFSR